MGTKRPVHHTNEPKEAGWESGTASYALELLDKAYRTSRPVVLLLGAGLSVESGIPLASQLSQYLVQVSAMVRRKGFANARQYLEEMRWPGRHDLRIDLMLELETPTLRQAMKVEERIVSQAALVSELRRSSPTLAFGLDEIFGQLRNQWNRRELAKEFGELAPFARGLAKRVPRNVAYRSLLFHLCDSSQALIDGCLDHFIRDRSPTTTHQFIVFLTQLLRSSVVLSTNFDPLLERAFAEEGIIPRVYEIQGEGTIPSARMLLSQHFSIVKLHGGAHQMRTGFDLDDPLSPAVLASFYELFDRLAEESGQKPLMLVMGYSGSDRRVMDIVNTHIKRWQRHEEPCVLWQNRDPWIPDLLRSAVETHPHVLYNGNKGSTDQQSVESTYQRFPAHLIRYADGRLFLLEAFQHLAMSFPISRSHYQAVNFVPHSSVRSENKKRAKALNASDSAWRLAMISAEVGGGSSSQLAELAHKMDSEYRIIWIDMAEVPGVSSLVDVVAERLVKFDHRLQPLRRPLLLNSLIYDSSCEVAQPKEMLDVETAEMALTVRWIQHALRRGQYLIALDSLDEFPAQHPALRVTNAELVGPEKARLTKETDLLCRLLHRLAQEPQKLGDSRIAIASAVANPEPGSAATNSQSDHGDSPHSLFDLQEFFRRRSGDTPELCFVRLPGQSMLSQVDSQEAIFAAWKRYAFPTKEQKVQAKKELNDPEMLLEQGAVVLAVAACGRRIRSAVSLAQVAGHFLAAIREQGTDLGTVLAEATVDRPMWSSFDAESTRSRGSKVTTEYDEVLIKWIRFFASDERWPKDCRWARIHVGDESSATTTTARASLQWFYRIEGGYQWMHRTVRDGLYDELLLHHKEFVCSIHHRLSEFCHHHLYDRSRDARAFLEYLFHRTAAIKLFASIVRESKGSAFAEGTKQVADWLRRAVRALQREKSAMLAMARLPSLIFQLRQLIAVIGDSLYPLVETLEGLGGADAEGQKIEVDRMVMDVFQILGDLLLAAGHPHSAVRSHVARVYMASNTGGRRPSADLSCEAYSLRSVVRNSHGRWKIRAFRTPPCAKAMLSIMSDLANAIQDPLLCHSELPDPFHEWTGGVLCRSREGHLSRQKRVQICKSIYNGLRGYCDKVQADVNDRYVSIFKDDEIELARTIAKRRLEFERLKEPTPLLATVNLYVSPHLEIPEWGCPLKASRRTMKAVDEIHAWRVTSKGPRHECYRLCLQARRIAQINLRDSLLWSRIQGLFGDAEAVVARHDDPADLQALAITRLTFAEHCVRRAEILAWSADKELVEHRLVREMKLAGLMVRNEGGHAQPSRGDQDPVTDTVQPLLLSVIRIRLSGQSLGRMTNETNEIDESDSRKLKLILGESRFCHDQAMQLLSSVDDLLNEGRGEIRWRFYYLLTLARSRMFQAMRVVDDAPVKAMNELNWSGRYLVAALGNCGRSTDRRFILTAWWNALRGYMRKVIGNEKQFAQEWARLRAQLGVDWNVNWKHPE